MTEPYKGSISAKLFEIMRLVRLTKFSKEWSKHKGRQDKNSEAPIISSFRPSQPMRESIFKMLAMEASHLSFESPETIKCILG